MLTTDVLKLLLVVCLSAQSHGLVTVTAWQDNELQVQEPAHPPPVNQTARMARYIVHISDWCSIGSISSQPNITGYPNARVYSFVDGESTWSSGIPYIYASTLDPQIQDLVVNNRCSVSVSLAESGYCKQQNYDPEDPRCAQVILTGRFSFLQNTTSEYKAAKKALFTRHPIMKTWPVGHNWKVGKLTIKKVQIVDTFGGSVYPSVKEYFQASPF